MLDLQLLDADVQVQVRALRRIQDPVSQDESLHPEDEAAGAGRQEKGLRL